MCRHGEPINHEALKSTARASRPQLVGRKASEGWGNESELIDKRQCLGKCMTWERSVKEETSRKAI